MKKNLFVLAASLLLAAPAALAQTTATPAVSATTAVSAGQRKAAEELLTNMKAEANINSAVDQMLTMQIQQRPEMKAVEPEMRSFLTKYMSWPVIKDDMVALYAREFTEKELRDINKFYQTPAGQKFVSKQSTLMQAGMEIGQRRVQENLPELQKMIETKMKPAGQ
ncbi:DUF2059 domain-containing protein [Hymenobacter jejuensis]|uniref:DUF2059 domain-containing protein n=1 Tax=Hymenobacter jejuensis TaxID=2502781 RepID=A0A5B8A1L1_9BACT|nr:DUF2059 domain-containing protein [Hymenobacter jejuensis]QDA61210.1 DUF2059 domain-containing protein [Hymenobacter jejuensis]